MVYSFITVLIVWDILLADLKPVMTAYFKYCAMENHGLITITYGMTVCFNLDNGVHSSISSIVAKYSLAPAQSIKLRQR